MALFVGETLRVDRDNDGSLVVTLDVPGRSVNLVTRQVLADLEGALSALESQSRLPVVVLRSGKKTGFLAGADLNEIARLTSAKEAMAFAEAGQSLFSRWSRLPGPTLAVIHGPCLGGGLELALACDYRMLFARENTQLGLPEVELGLLPAWGGTQRLPRIIGLERALVLLLSARRIPARQALDWGLADALATNDAEFREQYARMLMKAISGGKRSLARLPLRTWRQRFLESQFFGRRILFRSVDRQIRQRTPDDFPAPFEILECVRFGLERGLEEGLKLEQEAAGRLAQSPACRNLIHLFLEKEATRKGLEDRVQPGTMRIGILGAGVMGAGLAQLAAIQGFEVRIRERDAASLEQGLRRIDDLLAKAVTRGRVNLADVPVIRKRVRGTTGWEGFNEVDLIVEAVSEDRNLKCQLLREAFQRCAPSTVLATNTSSFTLESLRGALPDAGRFAGFHLFSPVHQMPLVEVVRHDGTADETVNLLRRFAAALGKTPVVVGDSPGFVVNRVLMPYIDEAMRLLLEGNSPVVLDRVMRRFGLPIGPLELLDQIGLDLAIAIREGRSTPGGDAEAGLGLLKSMVERGWIGRKSGSGFYIYNQDKKAPNREALALAKSLPSGPSPSSNLPAAVREAEARDRMVLRMVNESMEIIAEGICRESDLNLALILGAGWAPHRGGPLRYAESRGHVDILQTLERFASRLGPRFSPSGALRRRVSAERVSSVPGQTS